MPRSSPPLIPVTLLTGFLGSGKTTVLNHIMQQPAMSDALVIINEFGETALDHDLVTSSQENLTRVMGSGCICCTIRGDLVSALREIRQQFPEKAKQGFDRIIIETTGLADPTPIIHTLMTHPQVYSFYRLDGIVATIDLATANTTLDRFEEAVKQIAVADALLLTKADLCEKQSLEPVLQRLKSINPAADRYEVTGGQIDAAHLLDLGLFSTQGKSPDVEHWLREEAYHDHHDHHDHHETAHTRHNTKIESFSFSMDRPISATGLNLGLELLMSAMGEDILRVKAILNLEDRSRPMVLHGVQHILHPLSPLPEWPSEDMRSRFVFITRGIPKQTIEKLFRMFG